MTYRIYSLTTENRSWIEVHDTDNEAFDSADQMVDDGRIPRVDKLIDGRWYGWDITKEQWVALKEI